MTKINGDNSWDKSLNKTDSQPKTNQTQNSEKPSVFTKEGRSFARREDGLVVERYHLLADGDIYWRCSYEYDENGKMTKKTSTSLDEDGKPRSRGVDEYNEKGDETKISSDIDADGKLDYILVNEYDEKGLKTKEIRDDNADGKPDRIYTYEYDEKGLKTKETRDYNADGKPDEIKYYINDSKTSSFYIGLDKDADGMIDSFEKG